MPKTKSKTYNSGDSPVVTHLTTSPPVRCLSTAERTGSSVFSVLWSYVKDNCYLAKYIHTIAASLHLGYLEWLLPNPQLPIANSLAPSSDPNLMFRLSPSRHLSLGEREDLSDNGMTRE
jgi:hypothetical protein